MQATEAHQNLSVQTQALLVLFCAIAYFYAFKLNLYWFEWFEFSQGTNWVYLPSGLRLLFVLLLARIGGVGIALSSISLNYTFGDADAHAFNIITGLISGASPCTARYLAIRWLGLDPLLMNFTARDFFKVSVLFAVVNALLHQLWYFWMDKTPDFLASALAMGVGDWLGTVLVLATARIGVQLYKLKQSPKP